MPRDAATKELGQLLRDVATGRISETPRPPLTRRQILDRIALVVLGVFLGVVGTLLLVP